MKINENELREDLGTFGGAVKNGWLKDNFWVEEAILTKTTSGRICLKCHMGRWFGKDDELLLFPDGTGKNLDITAKDRIFKWKSIEVRSTSFAKSILIGAGIGAATGAGAGWAVGKFGGGAAVASTTIPKALPPAGSTAAKALSTAGSTAAKALPTAGSVAGSEVVTSITNAAGKAGLRYSDITKLGLKLQNGASRQTLIGMCNKFGYTTAQRNVALDLANKWVQSGGSALHERKKKKNVVNEEVNEVAPQAVGALIGAGVGAIGGGIYALVKNRDNVRYYSDGTYKTKKGTLEGRWDGSVEEEKRGNDGDGGNGSKRTTPSKTINIPGMPADFANNPENVKIAQRYLVANHANISTSKSVDGVDGKLGPRTKKAILAYMTQHKCDFAKFWQDAQEYNQTKQNVDNMKAQNLQAQMQQVQNLKLNKPEIGNQQQVQTVNEVKTQFFDMLNRINNATILQ
jgi:hypothetical protein